MPLQVRSQGPAIKGSKANAKALAGEERQKRSVLKRCVIAAIKQRSGGGSGSCVLTAATAALARRLDSDQLDSDSAYSEESDYMTDDSAERSSNGGLGGPGGPERRRAKVMRITSAAQLKVRCCST